MALYEFEASLSYTVNSRTARTNSETLLQNKPNNNKKRGSGGGEEKRRGIRMKEEKNKNQADNKNLRTCL